MNILNEKKVTGIKDRQNRTATGVDTSLITMFLKMTPGERLRSNDNAVNTIMELRNAFRQK